MPFSTRSKRQLWTTSKTIFYSLLRMSVLSGKLGFWLRNCFFRDNDMLLYLYHCNPIFLIYIYIYIHTSKHATDYQWRCKQLITICRHLLQSNQSIFVFMTPPKCSWFTWKCDNLCKCIEYISYKSVIGLYLTWKWFYYMTRCWTLWKADS